MIDGLQTPEIISDKYIYGGPSNCTSIAKKIRDSGDIWSEYVSESDLVGDVRPRIAIDLTEGGLYPPVYVEKVNYFTFEFF